MQIVKSRQDNSPTQLLWGVSTLCIHCGCSSCQTKQQCLHESIKENNMFIINQAFLFVRGIQRIFRTQRHIYLMCRPIKTWTSVQKPVNQEVYSTMHSASVQCFKIPNRYFIERNLWYCMHPFYLQYAFDLCQMYIFQDAR